MKKYQRSTKFTKLAKFSSLSLLSLVPSTLGASTMYGTPGCLNGDYEVCPDCYIMVDNSCFYIGSDNISPQGSTVQTTSNDFSVGSGASGCGPCGSGGAGGLGTGNQLPSVGVQRLSRPRSTVGGIPGNLHGSFGTGQYWAEVDKTLRISENGLILVSDPTLRSRLTIASFDPARAGWAALDDEYFYAISLYDDSGVLITDVADMQNARSATALMHDGSSDHYEFFWSRDTETAFGNNGHGLDDARGYARLVARMDRYGNAITVDYERAVPADGYTSDASEIDWKKLDDYRRMWNKSKVTDAHNREIQVTNTKQQRRYTVTSLALPTGKTINYSYGTMIQRDTLDKITHQDGTESTWSVEDSGTQKKVTRLDLSAKVSSQSRVFYFSGSTASDGNGGFTSQIPNLTRRVDNPSGETLFANNFVEDDNGVLQSFIHRGGNKTFRHTFQGGSGGAGDVQDVTELADFSEFYTPGILTRATKGRRTQTFDASKRLAQTNDAFSRNTSYTRNPLTHALLSQSHPDGSISHNTHNQFNQTVESTDRLGRVTLNTYDALGNNLTTTSALGTADETTTTKLYNIRGQIIEIRDALYDANTPELHNTKFEYDANNYLTKKIEAADEIGGTRPVSSNTYDAAGRITSTTDPLGRTVIYERDDRDRVTKTTYNDTSTELVEYGTATKANLVISRTDRNGIKTTYGYDAAHRIIETKVAQGLPEESITTCTYLTGTSKKLTVTRDGETTTYQYDYSNRLIGSTVQANANTALTNTTEYDQTDRLRSTTDAYGRKTYVLYDQNNRVIRTVTETVPNGLTNVPAIVPDSSQTSASHTYTLTDKDNNQLDTTDTHKVTYTDPRDLFLEALVRDNTITNHKYLITDSVFDAEGQRLITTDARGINSWTEYDKLGRTTLTIAAVGTPSEIRSEQDYDDNSNVTETRSPRHFTEGAGTTAALTGVSKDQYTYNGRNMRATHKTAVGSTEEAIQSWTYLLDGRSDEHTDFRGNILKQIWHACCGRLQAAIQRDGSSTTIYNTDYNGNLTHTASVNQIPLYFHNPINFRTLRETTTRFDGRGRPTHTTTWLTPRGAVDDDARISLGDATGIPISGLDGIPATDGLTTTYEYDEDLTDGIGIDADYTTQLTELNARYGYNPFSSSGLPAGAPSSNGYAVAVTNPAGETTVQITDGAGRTILTINPEGDLATMHYDAVVSNADLWSASNTPNQGTLLATKSIDVLGNENTSYTDAAGRTIASADAAGNISGAAYNANSSVVSTRDANGLGQDCDYDALNRPTVCADLQETAEGNDRTTTYNAASQVLTSTNADGETTTNVYDVRSRLESTTDPNNITTSYLYDANNNLITLEDGNNNQRHWFFDERNLNTTKVYPGNNGNDFYTQNFDALGRVSIKVDQIGTTCTMIYDLAGRLTKKQYHTGATPAQGGTVTQGPTLESTDLFTYDAASRILTTRKGRHNIKTEHTYAADSQPLTEKLIANNRTYLSSRTYDAANRPLTHTYPSSETTHWAYTDRNLVETVHYEDKHILTNTHDDGYRLTDQAYGNGLTRETTYNRQDNLRTSDKVYDGTQTLDDLNLSYQYQADKQISAENIVGDLIQNTSFTANYDAGNRITNWTRAGAPTNNAQTWNYDDAGNWNSTTKDGTTEARNHSAADQITSIAGNAATHDLKGNLTEYEINGKDYQVEYDLDNRIIKVDVDNDDVEYRYDALGRRVIRKEGTTKTALIWWGNSENAEHKHTATQTVIQNDIMSHPSRLNAVIARAVDGSKFKLEWYHKNYLDHVYAVSDDSGDLIEHYRYTAFGEVTIYNDNGVQKTTTQIENTIMWNTRRQDEVTGYYLYKYRHYDPQLGRWPSRDPIEESGGINLYQFCYNDGSNYWDKLGGKPQDKWYGYDSDKDFVREVHDFKRTDLGRGAKDDYSKDEIEKMNDQYKKGKALDPEAPTAVSGICKTIKDLGNYEIIVLKVETETAAKLPVIKRRVSMPSLTKLHVVKVILEFKRCVCKRKKGTAVKWRKTKRTFTGDEFTTNPGDYSLTKELAEKFGNKMSNQISLGLSQGASYE